MAFAQQEENLNPVSFFALQTDCQKKKGSKRLGEEYLLPCTTQITGDEAFASVRAGWSEKNLSFLITVKKTLDRSVFPRIEKGDAVELFIDTRDVKTSGHNTRFCHHFFFLPEVVDGTQCGELTHFRGDDRHDLCDPALLSVTVASARKSYEMEVEIPAECLVGYDPKQFTRFGFTYRVHRTNGEPLHFSAHSREFQIEEQPSLWATVNMV
jgi:hypothetical protein